MPTYLAPPPLPEGARQAAVGRHAMGASVPDTPNDVGPGSARVVLLTDSRSTVIGQLSTNAATGDVVLQDEFTTGVENYKEFFYTLVGLSGEGQNFDGNGMYVRFQTGGGSQTVSLGSESGDFEITGDTCTSPLAPGATCTATVVFTPVRLYRTRRRQQHGQSEASCGCGRQEFIVGLHILND